MSTNDPACQTTARDCRVLNGDDVPPERREANQAEITARTLAVTVSGKTYNGALDPYATDWPKQHEIPEPTTRTRGRGFQATYQLTRQQAEEMAQHLEAFGYNLADFVSAEYVEARREGRACLKDAEHIRAILEGQP